MINEALRRTQREWFEQVVLPCMRKYGMQDLSRPFCPGVSNRYLAAGKRVMVVGQEAAGLGSLDGDWSLPENQTWSTAYLERQLWNVQPREYSIKRNPSPFWDCLRLLECAGVVPCWNNLNKLHRTVEGNAVRIAGTIEAALHAGFGPEKKSLLLQEIAIARPDAVLFVTGPYYTASMAAALQVEAEELRAFLPKPAEPVQDVSCFLPVPSYWTYHPRYLRNLKKLEACVEEIAKRIGKT